MVIIPLLWAIESLLKKVFVGGCFLTL